MNKRGKRGLLVLLALCLVLAPAPAAVWAEEPWEGSGTEADPWLIEDFQDLNWLSINVNSGVSYEDNHFLLTRDINLEGRLWTPIGRNSAFQGHFDGGNHSVYNLYVAGFTNGGLFGFVGSEGAVENLGVGGSLYGGVSSGVSCVGGVAAMNRGVISRCVFAGSVSLSGDVDYAGGIVGYNEGAGTVRDCVNRGSVSAGGGSRNNVGGVVGMNYQGSVSGCENEGDVEALRGDVNCAGGIIGYHWDGPDPTASMKASDNTGAVNAAGGESNYEGPVVGYNNIEGAVNVPVEDDYVWVNPFTDVQEEAWYYDAVCFVGERGLMNGVSDTLFVPLSNLNRAMIVTVLWRMEGEPSASGMAFSDVGEGLWYTEAVAWASSEGVEVVNGTGNNQFSPQANLTREQMCAIFYRYAVYKGYNLSYVDQGAAFEDFSQVSAYAQEPVLWALLKEILLPISSGRVGPQSNASRADVAWALQHFLLNVAEE
ncbi:MAG: S-layer homology domain-containing protein [Bacillota bacterium]|nr:S-layer homology domain-containing protein [Bacillota bacterium]